MQVVKRDGSLEEFSYNKIKAAILKAFDSCCPVEDTEFIDNMITEMDVWDGITIEEIADSLGISRSYVSRIEKKCLIKLSQKLKSDNWC